MTCLREGAVELADGRRLGFGEYGRRGGAPVLFFHGMPGGRAFDLGRAVAEHGVWLFVLERPGIGLSDPHPEASVSQWPADVACFADAMGFGRFATAGVSAGAPYALACGHALGERVTIVVLLAAWVAFVNEPALDALLPDDFRHELEAYRLDPASQVAARQAQVEARCRAWERDPDAFYREFFGDAADTLSGYWVRLLAATYGVDPRPTDFVHEYEPWGFDVGEVRVPVRAWHGDLDEVAPLPLVEELVRRLPDARLTVCPGEGHFLHPRHRSEYFSALAQSASAPRRSC